MSEATGYHRRLAVVVLGLAAVAIAAAGVHFVMFADSGHRDIVDPDAQQRGTASEPDTERLFEVLINRPDAPPRVDLGLSDQWGHPVTASCATCHATREPDLTNRTADDMVEFHQGLTFQHGSLTCLSCHNRHNYDTLRLADGRTVAFPDVMSLCAQCHGPQFRDYQHGAHGGMTGYWDLSRGPRVRNNCVDCHDPHAPAFPMMRPTFKPRDRFLDPAEVHEDGEANHE